MVAPPGQVASDDEVLHGARHAVGVALALTAKLTHIFAVSWAQAILKPQIALALIVFILAAHMVGTTSASAASCLGEFAYCPATGECTLFECGGPGPHCSAGEYRCPISNACVEGAEGYLSCALAGTHLDHTLGTEERVSLLIAATNLTEQVRLVLVSWTLKLF
jgi:hypothetical protein